MDNPDTSQFSTFKYAHKDAVHRGSLRKLISACFFIFSAWCLFYASRHIGDGFMPVGIFTLIIALVIYNSVPRTIMIGPRYLLCGQTIIYYINVVRIVLHRNGDAMELHTAKGNIFTLERDTFPTGARREPKITNNKTEKFNKVSAKIIERVERVRPNVEKISY